MNLPSTSMLSPTHLLDAHTPLSPTSGLKRLPSYGSMQEVSRCGARADGLDLTAHGHPESLSPAQRGLNSSSAMRSRQGKSTSNHDATARNGHATEESHDMDRKRSPGWHTFGVHLLENKGSVARDHLAAERTYLAWLRTSLALASIGIAITQLFRLPSSTTITSPSSSLVQAALQSRSILSTAQQEQLLDQLASSTLGDSELTGLLVTLLRDQAERLDTLSQQVNDPLKYRHLGKPIGGTFIALALFFLVMGSTRYFRCQVALMSEPQSQFPPSRRSVVFASTATAFIIIATFATILAVR